MSNSFSYIYVRAQQTFGKTSMSSALFSHILITLYLLSVSVREEKAHAKIFTFFPACMNSGVKCPKRFFTTGKSKQIVGILLKCIDFEIDGLYFPRYRLQTAVYTAKTTYAIEHYVETS